MKDQRMHSTEAAARAAVLAPRARALARILLVAAILALALFVVALAMAVNHVQVPNAYWIAFFGTSAAAAGMYGLWWALEHALQRTSELDAFEYAAAGREAAESGDAAALLQRWCVDEGCDGVSRSLRLSGGDLQLLRAAWHAEQRRQHAAVAEMNREQARLQVSAAARERAEQL